MTNLNYQPKGDMCSTCKYKQMDCSLLPFPTMPVIVKEAFITIVRCVNYTRDKSE